MKKRHLLLILPFVGLNSVVIIAALFKSLAVSLGYYPIIGLNEVTLSYYREVLHDHYFVQSLLYSLYLGLLATVGALVLGLLMALALERVAGRHLFLARLFAVPITIPHIIVALMIMQLLSQSGLISRLAIHLHMIASIDDFPLLVNDRWGIAIIVVFLYKGDTLRGGYDARNPAAITWRLYHGCAEPRGLALASILARYPATHPADPLHSIHHPLLLYLCQF